MNQFKITIPEDFTNTLFTLDEILNPKDDFYSILVNVYYKNIQSMQIVEYEKVDYVANICKSCTRQGCYFPDCGETALRNFFNIIFYNDMTDTFDLRRLCEVEVSENLKEYYTKFNSITLQGNKTPKNIFGKELNARDAWAYIVSNLEDVNYLQTCKLDDDIEYQFEINSGLSKNNIPNILEVIGKLTKKNDFEDFAEIEIIDNSVDIEGLGNIRFKKKSTNAQYELQLTYGHYDLIEIKEKSISTIYTHLNSLQQKYLDLLLGKNIKEILENDINDIYLIKYENNEILINVLNNYCENLEDKKYDKIFKYIDEVFSPDEKRRINLFLSKISNLRNYNLKQYSGLIDIIFENDVITKLTFGEYFNSPVNHLPSTLKHVTFGKYFNQPVNYLPPTLTQLTFGYMSIFNQPVDNLPSTLTYLTLGRTFNQPVNHLPLGLTHVTFGENFNQPVNQLPSTLTHITFGRSFNQSVNDLPPTLTHLTFYYTSNFNQPVDNLPSTLTSLIFGYSFNKSVDELPKDLIELTFGCEFNQSVNNLPKDLLKLTFGKHFSKSVNDLPKHLIELNFGQDFNEPVDDLPSTLTHLNFGYSFNQPVNNLPSTLIHVKFSRNFNQPVNDLPRRLTQLMFSVDSIFNQPLNNLPSTLTHLVIPTHFRGDIIIPDGCKVTKV